MARRYRARSTSTVVTVSLTAANVGVLLLRYALGLRGGAALDCSASPLPARGSRQTPVATVALD